MSRSTAGDTLVDLLAPLLLTGLALAGWSTTYAGDRWLLAGLGGAALAGGLAWWLARHGWGADVLFVLLIPTYLVTAGPIAEVRLSSNLVQDLINATLDSWTFLVGSHPLLAADGALLLPPYVVGLLAGGLATSVALRSTSPGAPVLAPIVAFGLVQVLGRVEPGWLLGLAFGVAAVGWLLLRGLRLETRHPPVALLTRLGLVVLVLALAAGVARPLADRLPVDAVPQLVLRDTVPAYDVSEVTTPLAQFRRFTRQPPDVLGNLHDSPLVTVSGLEPGTRLRFLALDTYDQLQFRPGDQTVPDRADDRFLRIGREIDNPAEGEEVFVQVAVHKDWDSQWVPTAGALQWFGFDGRGSAARQRGFRYNPATATGVLTTDLTGRDGYEFSTVLTDDRLTPRMEPYPVTEAALYEQARFVHVPAHGWAKGETRPMAAVFRAAETLRTTGRYSSGATEAETKYGPGHDRTRIGPGFIHGSLTGDDEQYATVMALAAVRLGVPARVVVGAVVPKDGVVRGRDVAAWVELRVADGTWRTLPTDEFMSRVPPESDRFDQNPDPSIKLPPGTQLPDIQLPTAEPEPKPDKPAAPERSTDGESSWWVWLLGGSGSLLLLLAAAVPLAKLVRRRSRLHHPRVTRRYAGAWLELVDLARDLGIAVPRGLTRHAEALLIGHGEDAAWEADRTIFGIDDPDAAAAAEFWHRVDADRRALRNAAPWHRRLAAPFNPASLRRPARRGTPTKWESWRTEVGAVAVRRAARRVPTGRSARGSG